MSVWFDANDDLIVVPVEVTGPNDTYIFRFALDTGATGPVINAGLLAALGYDLSAPYRSLPMTTGSSEMQVTQILVQKLQALGQERTNFPVVIHSLPPSAIVDGLLGLDFLRGLTLTLDFANGLITLD